VVNVPVHNHEVWQDVEEYTPGAFNLFTGFKATLLPKDQIDMDMIEPVLSHLKNVWADKDEKLFKYLLAWHADVIQNPRDKCGTSLAVFGLQGSGKGIYTKFEEKYVYGKNLSKTANGIDSLVSKFNCDLTNMIMVNVDEISALKGEFHSVFDKLKNLITDDMIEIEGKFKKKLNLRNNIRLRFMTNNEYSMKVERGNRRYVPFWTSNEYAYDEDDEEKSARGALYGRNFKKNCFKQSVGDMWFTYLYYLEHEVDLSVIPKTEMRATLVEMNRSKEDLFIQDLIEKEHEAVMTGDAIYEEYGLWCEENVDKSVKRFPKAALIRDLVKITGEGSKTHRVNGDVIRGYAIPRVFKR
jgi:hypothetical protein